MAGIVAATANNGTGIAGIGWNVRVQPLRALGRCGGALTDIADAIRWAAGLDVAGVPANPTPARVISLSLGSSEPCTAHTQSAVDAAIAAGSVVVAATGNESDIVLISPANCRGVIAVTAHTINGENADYANIGAATTISAPGGGSPIVLGAGGPTDDTNWTGYYVWSTLLFGATDPSSSDAQGRSGAGYGGFTGTSVAAPHVAGAAALIKSLLPSASAGAGARLPREQRAAVPRRQRVRDGRSVRGTVRSRPARCRRRGRPRRAVRGSRDRERAAEPQHRRRPDRHAGRDGGWRGDAHVPVEAQRRRRRRRDFVVVHDAGAERRRQRHALLGDGRRMRSAPSRRAEATITVTPASTGGPASPPVGGGGGGGALPLGQLLLLVALLAAARLRRRE